MCGKYLIIGGSGFIGSSLAKRISNGGGQVTIYDQIKPEETNLRFCENAKYVIANTNEIDEHLSETYDTIFHFGEYARVEQSFQNIEKVLDSNIIGTGAVIQYAIKNSKKFIYAGSSTKFIPTKTPAPSPYSITKANNTRLVNELFTLLKHDFAICYFYNVYGPGENGTGTDGTVVQKFIDAKLSGKRVTITAPGTQLRNFTHIDDTCDALLLINKYGHGDGYGIPSNDAYSILELAEKLELDYELGATRSGNRLSAERIDEKTKNLGWSPKRNIEEYLKQFT